MKFKLTAFFISLAMLLSATDWPTHMYDNSRSGVSPETVKPPLHLQWTFNSPFPPAKGWAMPVNGYGSRKTKPNVSYDDAFRVVVAGKIAYFASSAENKVYAVDAATGNILWSFFTGASPRMAPVVWKNKIYFGADDGIFYCLEAKTGKIIWTVNAAPDNRKMLGQGRFLSLWPIRSGGIIDNGTVYFTAGLFPFESIFMFAVDAETGKVKMRKNLDQGGTGSSSPQGYILSTPDSLFLTSRVTPVRINKDDFAQISFDTPYPKVKRTHEYRYNDGGTYAQIWDKYLVFGRGAILAYDFDKDFKDKYGKPKKGGLVFNWFNARQIVFKNKTAYIATDYYIAAVPEDKLADLAKNECLEFEDEIYKKLDIASMTDHRERYDRLVKDFGENDVRAQWIKNGPFKWGKKKWDQWPAKLAEHQEKLKKKIKWLTPVAADEAMIIAGDVIYAGSQDTVYAIDAATGKELWQFKTGSRVRGLSAADKRLYVSTIDGKIRCFGNNSGTPKEVLGTAGPLPKDKFSSFYANFAKDILKSAGTGKGYCLILNGDGGLAYELAKNSELIIQILSGDAKQVGEVRKKLDAAHLLGGRVSIEKADLKNLPYPPYLFNIVIDAGRFFGGSSPTPVNEIFRVTRPSGGLAFIGQPAGGEKFGKTLDFNKLKTGIKVLKGENVKAVTKDRLVILTRGRVKDSKDWTHHYGNPGNTFCNEDKTVKGPFGILWYGEPGPRKRIDRHSAPPLPLVYNGIMYTIGYDVVMAYDIFNGLNLWEREIFGATRSELPFKVSNNVVDENGFYIIVEDKKCLLLDLKTGKTLKEFLVPVKEGAKFNFWSWIALYDGLLLGAKAEVDEGRRRPTENTSYGVFAIDPKSGKIIWQYDGEAIDSNSLTVGDGLVFFLDKKLTEAEKTTALKNTYRQPGDVNTENKDREGNPIPPDLRKIVALDLRTGKIKWQKPLNCTDITIDDILHHNSRVVGSCMYKDGILLVHGTGSLGHPHRQFLEGKFKRRALFAFDGKTGKFIWGGQKGYRKRPIIVGDYVYAEPFAWNLKTGKIKTIVNPLSGKEQILDLHRGYIGCGHLLASGSAIFGAKGGIAYYNLDDLSGFVPFSNMALSCGLDATPANGVFVAPEGRSGCTCGTPIYTSIVLYPREESKGAWGVGTSGGMAKIESFPVKHMFVNLGAPGYRQDDKGNLWIPYQVGLPVDTGFIGKWLPHYKHGENDFYSLDEDIQIINAKENNWLYRHGYCSNKPLSFKLIDKGQPAGTYTVKLYFSEPEKFKAGDRVFDIYLQKKTVLKDFDIVKEAGSAGKPVVKEFKGIKVSDNINIEMKPSADSKIKSPILCGISAVVEK